MMKKESFITYQKNQVQAYIDQLAAIPFLDAVAQRFDGKVANRRIVNAFNKAMYESPIRFKRYDGEEINSISVSFDNRYFILYHQPTGNNICMFSNPHYINNDGRFEYENFKIALNNANEEIINGIQDRKDIESKCEEALETYNKVKEYVHKEFSKLPPCLRPFYRIDCPIY